MAEREKVETWQQDGGSPHAVLVAVTDPEDGDATLERFPFLDDILSRPVTPVRLRRSLERAFERIQHTRMTRQLQETLDRKHNELSKLNEIGVALSAQRDIDQLLELILKKSREMTLADAGSLYLVEREGEDGQTRERWLRFKLAQNDSVIVPFKEQVVPLDDKSMAGYAAIHGEVVNIADAYRLPPGSPYQISRNFDEKSGYRTKSMLVVPMRDHNKEVIGVVQLINKKKKAETVLRPVSMVDEEVIAFTTVDEELVGSLASQAAVAYQNAALLKNIRDLFENFVKAAAYAIEQRDETTRGHSDRVAILTVGLARKVAAVSDGPLKNVRFTDDQMRELHYAALLHDFGKVGVREKVLLKEKKLLGSQLTAIQNRFAYIAKSLEAEHLRRKLKAMASGSPSAAELAALDAEYARRRAEVDKILEMVVRSNEPTVVVEEESLRALITLPRRELDWKEQQQLSLEDWARGPYLSARELDALSIPKGSLTRDEYRQIQNHVEETYRFLSRIPWTGEFRRIPEIARAHHEKLDGSGYPRRLTGKKDIPVQSRMMTIADIYDALVAQDRPYKHAVNPERALDILGDDMKKGKLDADLLSVFIEARVWDDPEFKGRIQRKRRR
jgi:HD-GYP domain-containing protein (c-di-GMP phosphodiesterase class II)